MDWILANPDFVPDSSDVPESSSGETVPPSPLVGGDQNTPVVAAPERTEIRFSDSFFIFFSISDFFDFYDF